MINKQHRVVERVYMGVLVKVLVTQLCPTLCNPMNCSPSSLTKDQIHGPLRWEHQVLGPGPPGGKSQKHVSYGQYYPIFP